MKHSIRRILSAAALLLIVCLFVTSCSLFGGKGCKHKETKLVGEIAASCDQAGYTGDTVCTKCEKVIKKGTEIAMLAHTYGEGKITKNPTCIETGTKTFTCSACGGTKTEEIAKVAHQDIFHDAQNGTHNHTCERCTLLENEKHTPVGEGVFHEASCEEGAYTEYVCSACEGVYKVYDETKKALGHKMGAWQLQESTCMSAGSKFRCCENEGCGHTDEIEIPVTTEHFYLFSHYESEPNCVSDGTAIYACRDCGQQESRTVPATGIHKYEAYGVSSDGMSEIKRCVNCPHEIVSFNALGETKADISADLIDKNNALEMNLQNAVMQFPQSVIGSLPADGNVTFGADTLDGAEKEALKNNVSSAEIKAALENAPIVDLTLEANGQALSEGFSEKVLITMPYDNGDQDADGIVIYYLANDGSVEEITDTHYDANKREITFFVDHFSYYAVAYRETQEMRCKRGNHVYEKTNQSVTATCYTFGYTLYECSCCHRMSIDDIVEKLAHNWGKLIPATPGCELGDYDKQYCQNEGCDAVNHGLFHGATGHKVDAAPTCTTPATCTKCKAVIVRALGHSYTEWETVVEATEEKNGIRRRYCLTCGKMEESKIAMVGAVKPINFDSFAELTNMIFSDLLDMQGGKITFTMTARDGESAGTVELMQKDGAYVMLLKSTVEEADGETFAFKGYYQDGAFAWLEDKTSNGVTDSEMNVGDIDANEFMLFSAFESILKNLHAELDSYVKNYLESARTLLSEEQAATLTAKFNEILAEAGLTFTVESLNELLDSIENLYAYMSLRLGYDTLASFTEAVVLPTREEIHAILSAFLTAEEKNGVTTYSCTIDPLVEAMNELVVWLDGHREKTVAEVFMDLFGADLKEYDSTLTDFDKVIKRIESEFPGTMKVSDAVDKFVTVFEKNGILTLDMLYSAIDYVGSYLFGRHGGGSFSVQEIITLYGDLTLDEALAQYMGSEQANMAALYAMAYDYCTAMKFGELPMEMVTDGEFETMNQLIENVKASLETTKVKEGFSFALDVEGNLVSFSCDEEITMTMTPGGEPTVLTAITVSFKNDAAYTVTAPAEFKNVSLNVSGTYDKDGNLVIEGLDKNVPFDIELQGSAPVDLATLLKLDEELSKTLGFKVYKTDKKYSSSMTSSGDSNIYLYNGKYYASRKWNSLKDDHFTADTTVDFTQILKDPSFLLSYEESDCDGYAGIETYNGTLPAWNLGFGVLYKDEGGAFMIATDFSTRDENGTEFYNLYGERVPFATFFEGFRLSSLENEYTDVLYEGKVYPLLEARFSFETAYDSGKTLRANCILVNDTLLGVNIEKSDSTSYFTFEDEIAFPAEDAYDEYEVEEGSGYMLGADGTPVMVSYEIYRFYTYQTTYYVKITDSLYAPYASIDDKNFKDWLDFGNDSIRKDFYTAGFESLTLPDGNVLSVIGRDSESEYCIANGYEAVYGYAKTADGLFIQTIAYTKDGKTVEVKYNGAVEKIFVSLDRLYGVQEYLTKKDGTYTVSASLINEIKKLCADEQLGFYFNANGKKTVGTTEVNYHYALGMQTNGAVVTLDNFFGGGFDAEGGDDFYDYFNGIKRGEASVALDENGNLILYYKDGSVITDLSFSFNGTFPADALLKKNESMSFETGLQIYSYKTENLYDAHRGSFIYENGKYYNFNTDFTYDVSTVATEKFLAGCEIYSMHYQFDIYPSEDLGALPVYSTELQFGENIHGSSYRMTVYTFFLDGKLQVAKQARQTGNSLLTFESYQPFSEYVASLEAVLETEYGYSSDYYLGSKKVTVYEANLAVFETDGKGNRLYNPDSDEPTPYATISVQYLTKNGKVEIICASEHLGIILTKGAQVTSFDFDTSLCEKRFEQNTYYNTEAEIVSFYQEIVEETHYNFVKLAGKYYDYNRTWPTAYVYQRITEAQFTQTSRDLVWYYMVVNPDTNERSFYTEFIPSDYGFKPAGKQLDESELGNGYYEDETLLGYTEEGYELYEVAYYTDSASEEAWTMIDQGDGTVFYHVNGKGYLRDQRGYFVPARQITNEDGKTEIVCMIRGAYVHDEYLNDNEEVLSKFISLGKGGSSLTLTRELLDFAKYNRQHFGFAYMVENGWSSNYEHVDYDKLSILFLTAEQQ